MMTLYALLIVLFSFPVSAWEPEAYNSECPEDGISMTAIEALPRLGDYYAIDFSIDADDTTVANAAAVPNYDYSVDTSIDYDNTVAVIAAAMPNDHSVDPSIDPSIGNGTTATVTSPGYGSLADAFGPVDDFFITDDYTSAVTAPGSRPLFDAPVDSIDWFADDDGWDFGMPIVVDHSIRASDWW